MINNYYISCLVILLILIIPRSSRWGLIKDLGLTLILSASFFSLNPIAGIAYIVLGGLYIALRTRSLSSGNSNFLHLHQKAIKWKGLGALCVISSFFLVYFNVETVQHTILIDLKEQDLLTMIIILFGLGTFGPGGKQWKN